MQFQVLVLGDGGKLGSQVLQEVVNREYRNIRLQGTGIQLGNIQQGAVDFFCGPE